MIYFFALLIQVALVVYVVGEAKANGDNPLIWGLLVFFFGNTVLGIYLIIRDRWGLGLFWIFGFPLLLTAISYVLAG